MGKAMSGPREEQGGSALPEPLVQAGVKPCPGGRRRQSSVSNPAPVLVSCTTFRWQASLSLSFLLCKA